VKYNENHYKIVINANHSTGNFMLFPNLKSKFNFDQHILEKIQFSKIAWVDSYQNIIFEIYVKNAFE